MHNASSLRVASLALLLAGGVLVPAAVAGPGGRDGAAPEGLGRAAATATCDNLNKRKLRTDTPAGDITTNSMTYVPIANAAQWVTVTTASCIVVTYSARTAAPNGIGNEAILIRARLDDTVVGRPSDGDDIAFSANDPDGWFPVRSFTWVFPSVAAGSHKVAMEFRSATGSTVRVYQHTLDIQYR